MLRISDVKLVFTDFPNPQPSASLPEESLVAALERTHLWSHFRSENSTSSTMKTHEILDSSISSLPQLSTGQAQMLALTRAIVQLQVLNDPSSLAKPQSYRGDIMPILLLDEATSSLDPETESAMRNIIRQEFTEKGHTVIAITHRLSGMTEDMRSGRDKVALLSKGKLERFGEVEDVLGAVPSSS